MSEELKPCPACGSCVLKVNHYTCIVECQSCGLRGPFDRESPEKAWNALPRRLRWTKEKPTVSGFYWWRDTAFDIMATIVAVDVENRASIIIGSENVVDFTKVDGEWAGPIQEPEDAK